MRASHLRTVVTEALAHFHFRVHELLVASELLGDSSAVYRDGYRMKFSIPSHEKDFGLSGKRDVFALGGGWQSGDEWTCRELGLVRLSVELDLPDAVLGQVLERETVDEAHKLLGAAADAARRYVRDYIDLIRTRHGQFWLAFGAQSPELVWLTTVIDRATGKRIRTGCSDPMRAVIHDGEQALSAEVHAQALRETERGESGSVPELLLADAMYLAWTADTPQYREAVLMAAVAAEVKIKETLDAVCAEQVRPILAFALNNPRDVSVQAVALYDRAAEAVTGRSLRKEYRDLYKSLTCLFEDRNAVAHRAHSVEPDQVSADLIAARDAILWAGGLAAPAS
jgi:hypothetical protein